MTKDTPIKKTLKARDIERLENTSFSSLLVGGVDVNHIIDINGPTRWGCSASCQETACCSISCEASACCVESISCEETACCSASCATACSCGCASAGCCITFTCVC